MPGKLAATSTPTPSSIVRCALATAGDVDFARMTPLCVSHASSTAPPLVKPRRACLNWATMSDPGPARPSNRLAQEASPYLQQHAHNPVDWYPWGPEALAEARRRDVPILLSIGYSACHWCHVMAHESFEDETTAALMNRLFVNVKVDRE